MKQVLNIIRYLFIILWMYAAILKLVDYKTFLSQLKLQPLPDWSVSFLSIALPVGELLLAVAFLFRRTFYLGLVVSFALMFCFSIYVLLALGGAFGKIPCACAGIIGRLPWREHLIFNIFFTALAFIGLLIFKKLKEENFVKHRPITS